MEVFKGLRYMNIPIQLTLLRIVLIPLLVVFFYLHTSWAYLLTLFVFAVAAMTDWLDGYLARSLNQTSTLGAFLDPVADKLIVSTVLVLLVNESTVPFIAIPVAIIIGREIAVSALREWMAEIGNRASVAVSYVGKIKTVMQMIAILFLLISRAGFFTSHYLVEQTGNILLYIAALLTIWTMLMYIRAAWKDMVLSAK